MANPIPWKVRQLPLVGPWAARIGRTVEIWGQPCNTPIEIWVLAAWMTIPRCLIMLIKPSAIEYGRSRFGRKHGKRPKIRLTGLAQVQGIGIPIKGKFTWILFRLSGVGAAILQYIQFIDVSTRGLLQWSTMVYTFSGCQVPGGGSGAQHASVESIQSAAFGRVSLGVPTIVDNQDRCIGAAFRWACEAGLIWSASYTVEWEDIPGQRPGNVKLELCDGAGNPIENGGNHGKQANGVNLGAGFYRSPTLAPSIFTFSVFYTADGPFKVLSATFTVAGGPPQNFLKPDP